jgi:hypothetical protein
MLAVSRLVSSGNERFDPTSLLWSVRTDEETHQFLKNSEDHLTNDEPFKDGSSASIASALSQVMRRDTIFNVYIYNHINYVK